MTTQQKIAFIREACIKANPEIVELKIGSHVLWGEHGLGGCILQRNYAGNYLIRVEGMGTTTTIKERQITKIIGRPVRLADVLLASKGMIHDIENDGEYMRTFELHEDGSHDLQIFWNLRKDSLEDQSEDTIEFIYSLLK